MRSSRYRCCIALILLVLASLSASADTVSLTLLSVGPGSQGGPNAAGGVYVYPYYFSINGSPTLVALLCDDYNHDVYLNESWTATTSTISNLAGALTPVSSPPAPSSLTKLQAYKEAAWLFGQLGNDPPSSKAAAINFAIWGIFSSSALNSSSYASSGAAPWRSQADSIVPTLSAEYFDQFVFYTPVAGSQPRGDGIPQEYIGMVDPATPVPEPNMVLLVASGCAGVWLSRKWLREPW